MRARVLPASGIEHHFGPALAERQRAMLTPQPTAHDEFVVQYDHASLLGMTGGGLAFVAVGVSLTVDASGPLLLRVTGLVCIVFFGGWGAVAARHVASFGPALVLDREGIVDQASLARVGRIRWSAIAGFRIARVTGNRLLVIRLREPERILRDAGVPGRLVRWASLRFWGSPVVVPELILRGGGDELLAACRRFRAAARKRGDRETASQPSTD
jgi:hypothetical protein